MLRLGPAENGTSGCLFLELILRLRPLQEETKMSDQIETKKPATKRKRITTVGQALLDAAQVKAAQHAANVAAIHRVASANR